MLRRLRVMHVKTYLCDLGGVYNSAHHASKRTVAGKVCAPADPNCTQCPSVYHMYETSRIHVPNHVPARDNVWVARGSWWLMMAYVAHEVRTTR